MKTHGENCVCKTCIMDAQINQLRAKLQATQADLEKYKQDAERLNHIEHNLLEVSASGSFLEEPTYQIHKVTGGRNDREWEKVGEGETLREALDAAMNKEV